MNVRRQRAYHFDCIDNVNGSVYRYTTCMGEGRPADQVGVISWKWKVVQEAGRVVDVDKCVRQIDSWH